MVKGARWFGLAAAVLTALGCGSAGPGTVPAASAAGASSSASAAGASAAGASAEGGSSQAGSASGGGAGPSGTAGASAAGGGVGGTGGQLAVCPFGANEHFLWSAVAPGDNGTQVVEKITERSQNPQLHDRVIDGVSRPSLFPYLAAVPNGAAAIIIPGGGYKYTTFDKEGVDIAAWLNSLGISAFVLKYRLPPDFPGTPWVPLADAQRALRAIRKSAAACAIDPARIGVIGFSAGGHLASQLLTRFDSKPTAAADDIDAQSARPDFGILMYPVISMDPAIAHAGSRTALLGTTPSAADVQLYSSELQVTSSTPATFVATSKQDTAVKPENSQRFDAALLAAGVARELHLYTDGAHGTGIRNATGDMAAWPDQAAAWLGSK